MRLGDGPGKYLLDPAWDRGLNTEVMRQPVIETETVKKQRILRLEIRTSTDVEWGTINTANATAGAKEKLRSMWYNGYSAMYPSGTEWRIRDDWI